MSSVDLFLDDERQRYGNMEEAASVAELRLRVHLGRCGLATSKRQAPSPALRCEVQCTQAHDLGVMRYLDCPEDSFENPTTPGIRLHSHRSCSCADLAKTEKRDVSSVIVFVFVFSCYLLLFFSFSFLLFCVFSSTSPYSGAVLCFKKRLGKLGYSFHLRQSVLLVHSGRKEISSWILF